MDTLHRLADALAAGRAAFLAAVDSAGPALRDARPDPEAWSPVEVLEHLVRAEGATLDGLERQLAAGDARKDVGPASAEAAAALIAAMESPVPIRIPRSVATITPEGAPYDTLHARFVGYDARWAAIAGSFPEALEDVGLIRHPVVGSLTAADAARFTAAHTARHRGQVERAVRALRG